MRVLRAGIAACKQAGDDPGSSEWTAACMEQAPVTIFILNGEAPGKGLDEPLSIVDIQAIGGAIQTTLLAAQELGLGALWICDVFYAYHQLLAWIGRDEQMVAAVSIGYPAESPDPRPRRPWQEITTWL